MSEKTIDMLFMAGEIAATVLIGWIIIKIILHIEKKALEKSKLDEAVYLFVQRASKIIMWIILFVTVLPKFGVSPNSLIAVLGAGGAAIALALKDSLGNVAGGIIILINKPFNKGDTIEVGGMTGVVDSIDLLTTNLHTFDNKVVTVPNGTITTSILTNYSQEENLRVDCTFGISYKADINKAKELLLSVAYDNSDILKTPEPFVGVSARGDSMVLLDFRVWGLTENYYDIKYYLEEKVKTAFDDAGIGIAHPQMDIHMVK